MPKLEEPNFVLCSSDFALYLRNFVFLLGGLIFGYGIYYSYFIDKSPFWVVSLLSFLCLSFVAIALSPNSYKKDVSFTADKQGCYFRNIYYNYKGFTLKRVDYFKFVPWNKIGKIYIDKDEDGTKIVMLQLKVSDKEWEEDLSFESMNPKWAAFLKSKKDENGYRNYALGNHCRNVQKNLIAIEEIRKLSKDEPV